MDASYNSFVAAQQKPGATNGTGVPGAEVAPTGARGVQMPANGQAGDVGASFSAPLATPGSESQNRTLWFVCFF